MPRKIMFVFGYPTPFTGAAWTRVHYFASYFSKNGATTVLLASLAPSNMKKPKKTQIGNVTVLNMVPTIPLNHLSIRYINVLISFIFSWMFILIIDPDVIILSVPPFESASGIFMTCKLFRKKIVFDYRDEWEDYIISQTSSRTSKFFYTIVKQILTHLYLKSQYLTTVTPFFKKSLIHRNIKKIRLIPNGADLSIFKQYEKKVVRKKLLLVVIRRVSIGVSTTLVIWVVLSNY